MQRPVFSDLSPLDPRNQAMAAAIGEYNDNPFYGPLAKFAWNLRTTRWYFPFIPALINSVILILVLVVLCVLYLTVGIAAQLSASFQRMMNETRAQMNLVSAIERSGYAVAIGIYSIIFLPLWLIQLPFHLIGIIWGRLGFYTLAPMAAAGCLLAAYYSGALDTLITSSGIAVQPSKIEHVRPAKLEQVRPAKVEKVQQVSGQPTPAASPKPLWPG